VQASACMLKDFYLALAPVSFTLLGLWLLIVQTRHAEWRHSAEHRRRAYAVWLQFALPGLMSLISLIDPASQALWRVTFAVVAIGGVVMLLALRGQERAGAGAVAYLVTVVLYGAVALVAIAPAIVNHFDTSINALRAEAIMLSLLVFLGVNIAWFLLFEEFVRDGSD
jgi:hypothetical protein